MYNAGQCAVCRTYKLLSQSCGKAEFMFLMRIICSCKLDRSACRSCLVCCCSWSLSLSIWNIVEIFCIVISCSTLAINIWTETSFAESTPSMFSKSCCSISNAFLAWFRKPSDWLATAVPVSTNWSVLFIKTLWFSRFKRMSEAKVEFEMISFKAPEVEFRLAYTLDTKFAVSSVIS